jgi:hypothetical protein
MPSLAQLEQIADGFEERARKIRDAIALLSGIARDRASVALSGKLRTAKKIRAEVQPAAAAFAPTKPAKGALLLAVGELFASARRIHEKKLVELLQARGFEGRGIGSLFRAKHLAVKRGGWIVLTKSGQARLIQYREGTVDRDKWRAQAAKKRGRPRKTSTPGTNGKGHGDATNYVAELVRANQGPISGTDILAKAKADGRKLTPQAIGAAMRHRLIAAAPPEGGERMFSVPA